MADSWQDNYKVQLRFDAAQISQGVQDAEDVQDEFGPVRFDVSVICHYLF